jgi:hypothetical protein
MKKKKTAEGKKEEAETRPYMWGQFDALLKRAISTPSTPPPARKHAPKSA